MALMQIKKAITGYFMGTNITVGSPQVPWGGAFLNWVMLQAGTSAPGSAVFTSWLSWGESVPVERAAPGMVVIFDFPRLPEARSRLLVGILMRKKADCVEIIAGNVVDRVVLTCVAGTIKSVRKPSGS